MSPKEYDTILYRDLLMKLDGFKDRLEYEENLTRRAAFAAYLAPHLNPKKLAKKLDDFWPLNGKGDVKKVTMAEKRKAIREALKEMNNG